MTPSAVNWRPSSFPTPTSTMWARSRSSIAASLRRPFSPRIPTKDIALRMLHNTVTVMNIFREEKGMREYPFFEHEDLWPLEEEILGLEFKGPAASSLSSRQIHSERVHLRGGIQARFIPAGHVLGAAGVLFRQQNRVSILHWGCILSGSGPHPGGSVARFENRHPGPGMHVRKRPETPFQEPAGGDRFFCPRGLLDSLGRRLRPGPRFRPGEDPGTAPPHPSADARRPAPIRASPHLRPGQEHC